MELHTATFQRAELVSEAVAAGRVQARYDHGQVEAAAVWKAAERLAGQHAEEVAWAAGMVRQKLSTPG